MKDKSDVHLKYFFNKLNDFNCIKEMASNSPAMKSEETLRGPLSTGSNTRKQITKRASNGLHRRATAGASPVNVGGGGGNSAPV